MVLGAGRTASCKGQQLHRRLCRPQGLAAPNPLVKLYDFSGATGGPIQKDRIWFFVTARSQGSSSYIPVFYNQNAGNPNAWLYVPDRSHQAVNDKTWVNGSARLTMQLSPRNKLESVLGRAKRLQHLLGQVRKRRQLLQRALLARSATATAICFRCARSKRRTRSPLNNKILFEGGFGYFFSRWGGRAKDNPNTESLREDGRAVLGRLRGERQHSGPDYRSQTVESLQRRPQQERHDDVARVGVVCHRSTEPEVRLPGQPARRHPLGQSRPERRCAIA